uniref:Uncharacterized protein n=1 Tax=Glossina brevipalpis TaxID=37001 RepID=A0A1A9WWY3_9MUSC
MTRFSYRILPQQHANDSFKEKKRKKQSLKSTEHCKNYYSVTLGFNVFKAFAQERPKSNLFNRTQSLEEWTNFSVERSLNVERAVSTMMCIDKPIHLIFSIRTKIHCYNT